MLNKEQTEQAIKFVKDTFEKLLAINLRLRRVTAPLFVKSSSGLNDTLNGNEPPVKFYVPALGEDCEIVQSLAKWKRMKLGELGFEPGHGIYTDMNAIRPNENLDELHSLYVDQWDWEKVITEIQCDNGGYLIGSVMLTIYRTLIDTYYAVCEQYPEIKHMPELFPDYPHYTSSDKLAEKYPDLTPKEREYEICKEKKAVFITKIGGKHHDGMRAPDYDDWEKNGDLLIWSPEIQKPIEITSMGVRVNSESLHKQLEASGHLDWEKYEYHKKVLNNELPYTVGGGIGQSRLCMLLLHKHHIGEVQVSVWPNSELEKYQQLNIDAAISKSNKRVNLL